MERPLSRLPAPARRLLHRAYLEYCARVPIARGKHRLGVIMDALLGLVPYPIAGGELELTPTALLDRHLIAHGIHDAPVVDALRARLRAGDVFLDVGANIGFMTLVGADAVGASGRVYAFEPSPRELPRLRRNVERSGLRQVTVVPVGVGPQATASQLYLAGDDNPGMNTRYDLHAGFTATPIQLAPIHELVPEADLRRVRVVKVDVEGDELSVLDGMRRSMAALDRASFVVEVTPPYLKSAGGSAAQLYAFFAEFGFRPTVRPGPSGDAPDQHAQYDEIFVPAAELERP